MINLFKGSINAETILYKDIRKHVFNSSKKKYSKFYSGNLYLSFPKSGRCKKVSGQYNEATRNIKEVTQTLPPVKNTQDEIDKTVTKMKQTNG
nr:hypothetical protein [Bacillus mycoides]